MDIADRSATAATDAPPERSTLGMPAGSVRALLTLMTVGFIVIATARGQKVGLLWFESLMIVLAHYFASRRLVHMSRELRTRLIADGVIEAEQNPLYLPRYSLRLIIIAAFAGLAAYLWREGRLLDPAALPVLIAVAAYFFGIIFHSAVAFVGRRRPKTAISARFDDIRALVTLGAMTLVIAFQIAGLESAIPFGEKLQAVPLALMLFYFGSR